MTASTSKPGCDSTILAVSCICSGSASHRHIQTGDAEDSTWEFVLENHSNDIRDCSILVAPHHGRDSGMDFSYLKTINPKLVLMGCACSNDLAYDAFRDYWRITNNQAGNVVAEADSGGINIFVENETFAKACGVDFALKNDQGYSFLDRI